MFFLSRLFDRKAKKRASSSNRSLKYRPSLEALEGRDAPATVLPSTMYFDFVTSSSPLAPGYTRASLAAYTDTKGYGWSSTSGMGATNRSASDPLTRDFHYGTDKTFRVN